MVHFEPSFARSKGASELCRIDPTLPQDGELYINRSVSRPSFLDATKELRGYACTTTEQSLGSSSTWIGSSACGPTITSIQLSLQTSGRRRSSTKFRSMGPVKSKIVRVLELDVALPHTGTGARRRSSLFIAHVAASWPGRRGEPISSLSWAEIVGCTLPCGTYSVSFWIVFNSTRAASETCRSHTSESYVYACIHIIPHPLHPSPVL